MGIKYQSRQHVEPDFNGKGIERVKRDRTLLELMIEEVVLRILFRTKELLQVKSYCQKEWTGVAMGGLSVEDFCIVGAVRLGTTCVCIHPHETIS